MCFALPKTVEGSVGTENSAIVTGGFSHHRLVVGIGARANATAAEVLGLIDGALAVRGHGRDVIAACATVSGKRSHPALMEAAARLGVPLLVPDLDKDVVVPNPSATVKRLAGRRSVAEAVALSFGPLVVEKQKSANATCALAIYAPGHTSSADMAASTVSASSAGP
jgi:cobalt-precorrin 5A hydrolase